MIGLSSEGINKRGKKVYNENQKDSIVKSAVEEERFWDTHDLADYIDFAQAKSAFFPQLKPSNKTISIRLPESLIEAIRLLANRQDIPYQSMLKVLLQKRSRRF